MELTSTYEGGKKWDSKNQSPSSKTKQRVSLRLFSIFSKRNDNLIIFQDIIELVTPHEIFLEGTLPHKSQILVSDAEERLLEEEYSENEGDAPAVILSSKMTLSLISLDHEDNGSRSGKQLNGSSGNQNTNGQ